MLVSVVLACLFFGAVAFSPRRAQRLGLWLRPTGSEPAFTTEGVWDEEGAPTAFISNSEDNIKALQANEKTLMLYKSFRNWSSEYISAKVNSALNSDMRVLSRIANGGDGKKKTRPSRGGESGGTRAGGYPRKSSANRRVNNKRPESESTAEVSIGEQEVRSGLIALLTLHELAAGPNATAADPSGASAQTTSSWRNPESPEELARFAKEVENLGVRLPVGDEQREKDGTMSTVSSGLRVTGAKASWKKSFRAGAAEKSGDVPIQGNKAADGFDAESGFDMDRLIVSDLATNLLTIVREDLRARLTREADSSASAPASVSAQSLNAGDATIAGKGERAPANPALQQQLQGGLGRHRSRRASGRDKAKAKARVWPPEVELLSEYAIFESTPSMQQQHHHHHQQQQYDVGAVNGSLSPSASIAGSGSGSGANTATATATLRPFLAAPKRHTEICKVTEELFVRRESLLFRPGYCNCLSELCSSLLLWSHRVQALNSSAQVLGAMARHRQSPTLELVLALFTPLPGPSAGPGSASGREQGQGQGQGQGQRQRAERGSGPSAFSFWSSFYTVFTAMREEIATDALSLKAVFDSGDQPHPSAAAVQLLKMGLLASVRVGYRSGFGAHESANVTHAGARAGDVTGATIGNSRATRGFGATILTSSSASSHPHHHNSSSFNASDVYATLELCLRIPPANMAAAAAAEANAASTLRTFSSNTIASRQGSLSGLGGDSKTELASSVVRSLLQQGLVDAALACFTLVLRSKESVNSRTVELLAFRVLSRGGAQGATDKKLALRMLDLLAQRRYLCSLGTLKLAMQRLVEELAQRAERGTAGADDWEHIKRLLASVRALAPKTDTRPRVLVETLALQLTSLGLDFPPSIVGRDTLQASAASRAGKNGEGGWFEDDVGEFHVSTDY